MLLATKHPSSVLGCVLMQLVHLSIGLSGIDRRRLSRRVRERDEQHRMNSKDCSSSARAKKRERSMQSPNHILWCFVVCKAASPGMENAYFVCVVFHVDGVRI